MSGDAEFAATMASIAMLTKRAYEARDEGDFPLAFRRLRGAEALVDRIADPVEREKWRERVASTRAVIELYSSEEEGTTE